MPTLGFPGSPNTLKLSLPKNQWGGVQTSAQTNKTLMWMHTKTSFYLNRGMPKAETRAAEGHSAFLPWPFFSSSYPCFLEFVHCFPGIPWWRKCPGKFHGQRSLAGYSPWGRKESGMTEQLPLPWTTQACAPLAAPNPLPHVTLSLQLQWLGVWGWLDFLGSFVAEDLISVFKGVLCMLNISPLGVCLRNIIVLGTVACPQDSPGPGEKLPEFSMLLIYLFVCLFFHLFLLVGG